MLQRDSWLTTSGCHTFRPPTIFPLRICRWLRMAGVTEIGHLNAIWDQSSGGSLPWTPLVWLRLSQNCAAVSGSSYPIILVVCSLFTCIRPASPSEGCHLLLLLLLSKSFTDISLQNSLTHLILSLYLLLRKLWQSKNMLSSL